MVGDFAEQILELELKLEESKSFETIKELNQMYRKGIDYYIDEEPRKARLLHKKMTALLMRPSILEVLELNTLANEGRSVNQQKAENLNRRLKTEIGKFHTNANSQIQYLLQKQKMCIKKLEHLKNEDINKQKEQLYDRMLRRVRSQEKIREFRSCRKIAGPDEHQEQTGG